MLKDFVLEGSETIGQKEIYHYTSVESLFKIVESKSLRLCSTKYMNDWKEMLMIRDVTNETLLLNATSIEAKTHFKLSLKSVIYDLEKQCEELSVNEYRKEKRKTIRLCETDFGLSFYASSLKSGYFSDEKEVRIVYNPNITVTGSQINIEGPLKPLQYFHTNGTLKPFFELKLFPLDVISSITIGPNCRLNENELKRFLVNCGFSIENIKIKNSELPFVAG